MRGRKPTLTEEKIKEFKKAIKCGMNIEGACCQAGISIDAYYRYAKKYPDFRKEIKVLQNTVKCAAQIMIARAVHNGDLRMCRWVLEEDRRLKDIRERMRLIRAQRKRLEAEQKAIEENGVISLSPIDLNDWAAEQNAAFMGEQECTDLSDT